MYGNISEKLKSLAVWCFTGGAIISVIGGAVILLNSTGAVRFVGLIVMIAGSLISWISSWFIYALGEIIEKLTDIEYNTRNSNNKQGEFDPNDPELKELKKFLDNGLISKEEFEEICDEVLN